MCCGKDSELPEKYEENRSCTDILFLIVFIIFWIGFIFVAILGFANGDPDRILYGTDYLGFVCGKAPGPPDYSKYVTSNSSWQSMYWEDNTFLFYPIQPNSSAASSDNESWLDIFDYGVCVKECPYLDNETLWYMKNQSYNFAGITNETFLNLVKVPTYGYTSRLNTTVFVPIFQWVIYSSKDFYRRCIPSGISEENLNETLASIPGGSKTGKFFFRGIMEVGASWRVFIIITFICLIACFIWVFMMKCCIKPLTYIVLLCILLALLVGAYLCYDQAQSLEAAQTDPPDPDAEKYINAWYGFAIFLLVCALIFIIFVFFFWKRINEACAMIQIGGRIIFSSPTMLIVPPVIAFCVILIAIWCIYVALYLYTAESYTEGRPETFVVPWPEYIDNETFGSSTWRDEYNNTLVNATNNFLDSEDTKRNLLLYDLFGFLWTMGFICAFGFTLVAFCSVFWYYSSPISEEKAIPVGGLCKATCWTFVYHMGTIALGSFLVALVQFIRIIFRYIASKCEKAKGSDLIKCLLCYIECCLACWERIIRIISKNAYIMMCITSDCFCFAARDAFNIILDNMATFMILNCMYETVVFLGKLLVIIGCCVLAWWMMDSEDLAPGVETKIFPLIIVIFICYFLASMFFDVYTTTIDSAFICYHHDLKVNAAKGMYWFPEELDGQIKGSTAAINAKKYKQTQQKEAAGEPYPDKKDD